MRFIGQVALAPEIFGTIPAQMAYLFITDDPRVDGTWEADGGENALILQPGKPEVATKPFQEGPTLARMEKKFFGVVTWPQSLEFGVHLLPGEDPDWLNECQRNQLPKDELAAYLEALEGNKIGGTPGFIQNDEFPAAGSWKLVLQLDSVTVPFGINFGDAGVGYAFLSEDGSRGRFLWQCC